MLVWDSQIQVVLSIYRLLLLCYRRKRIHLKNIWRLSSFALKLAVSFDIFEQPFDGNPQWRAYRWRKNRIVIDFKITIKAALAFTQFALIYCFSRPFDTFHFVFIWSFDFWSSLSFHTRVDMLRSVYWCGWDGRIYKMNLISFSLPALIQQCIFIRNKWRTVTSISLGYDYVINCLGK